MTGERRPDDDELNRLLGDLEHEFGPRRPGEGPPQPPAQPPAAQVLSPPQPPQTPEPPQASPNRARIPLGRPRASYTLLALIVGIWLVPALLDAVGLGQAITGRLLGMASDPDIGLTTLLRVLFFKENRAIYEDGEYYRLISAMFLHGGIAHIAFNAFALYSLGPECERLFGTARFLAIYFVSGLAGSLASYALNAAPSLGASGAIFGLIGALSAFYYVLRKELGQFSQAQLGNMAGIVLINLLIGFTAPGIDNWAHMGGLLGGALVGFLLTPRYVLDPRFFPPRLTRNENVMLVWGATLALALALLALAGMIVPPLN